MSITTDAIVTARIQELRRRAVDAFVDGELFTCSREEFQFIVSQNQLSQPLPTPGQPAMFMGQRVFVDKELK